MFRNKTFVCIIPARGGSKGVPNKNIRLMLDKPMISYCIAAAKNSGIFDKIVVTTDSEKIKTVSQMYDVEVIDRPSELAQDKSLVGDAIVHALTQLDEYDYVLLLEPTSPLVIGADILKAAIELLNAKADMIITVCKASPDWVMSGRLGPNKSLKHFLPKDIRECPRQDRPDYYYLNGGFYIGKWEIFAQKKDFYEQDTIAFVMHPEDSIHIDTEVDWIKAEGFLKRRQWAKAALNG